MLQYAEGHGGEVLGSFCISRGRYLWTVEEDFPLFLLSMYRCSKQILEERMPSGRSMRPGRSSAFGRQILPGIRPPSRPGLSAGLRSRVQAELAYLLAQQFIDGTALFGRAGKGADGGCGGQGNLFYARHAGAKRPNGCKKRGGSVSIRIQKHRLYLKNREGRELGYLSFADDRLYYVVIPCLNSGAPGEDTGCGKTGGKEIPEPGAMA